MAQRIDLANTIVADDFLIPLGERQLVVNPNRFTMRHRIRYSDYLRERQELTAAQQFSDVLRRDVEFVTPLLQMDNPDWTEEDTLDLNLDQIEWIILFFRNPSGAHASFAAMQQAKTATVEPTPLPTPEPAARGRKSRVA